jgi:hypothetical protein
LEEYLNNYPICVVLKKVKQIKKTLCLCRCLVEKSKKILCCIK